GYARLVRYTPALALVPDMLIAADVSEGRIFTLRLRPGHKWSDGHPFTAEDFRYWFDDVAQNPELSAGGLPTALLPNGEAPKFEAMYKNDNPDLPSLEPWILKTRPPADRLVFERNPYYYRVDGAGHQLPYIDRVIYTIADSKIIAAKTGAGESDLQARYLRFDDYTFLKAGEGSNKYHVRLWRTGPGS